MKSWVLGRSRECDYIIQHPNVSAQHATVEQDDHGHFYVRDLGSTNGVYLNSTKERVDYSRISSADTLFLSKSFSVGFAIVLDQLLAPNLRTTSSRKRSTPVTPKKIKKKRGPR